MARKSHNKRHRGHRRGHRGGTLAPLQAGAYPGVEMNSPQWSASVAGGPTGAGFKSFIQQTTGGATGMPASAAMNKYALEGGGQSGSQSGGGSRRRRHRKMGTRRRRGGGLGGLQGGNKLPMMGGPPSGVMKAAPAPHAMGAKAAMPHTAMAKPTMPHTATGRSTTGGMFATFGALLKEALVPLGLLAAQQTYGRKHRSSGSHTRKHRR